MRNHADWEPVNRSGQYSASIKIAASVPSVKLEVDPAKLAEILTNEGNGPNRQNIPPAIMRAFRPALPYQPGVFYLAFFCTGTALDQRDRT